MTADAITAMTIGAWGNAVLMSPSGLSEALINSPDLTPEDSNDIRQVTDGLALTFGGGEILRTSNFRIVGDLLAGIPERRFFQAADLFMEFHQVRFDTTQNAVKKARQLLAHVEVLQAAIPIHYAHVLRRLRKAEEDLFLFIDPFFPEHPLVELENILPNLTHQSLFKAALRCVTWLASDVEEKRTMAVNVLEIFLRRLRPDACYAVAQAVEKQIEIRRFGKPIGMEAIALFGILIRRLPKDKRPELISKMEALLQHDHCLMRVAAVRAMENVLPILEVSERRRWIDKLETMRRTEGGGIVERALATVLGRVSS